jgi:hypothetical protein
MISETLRLDSSPARTKSNERHSLRANKMYPPAWVLFGEVKIAMMPNIKMRCGWLYSVLALIFAVLIFVYYESVHQPSQIPKATPPIHDQR